jgi:diguanylate cyclase (GGDEF)-like protein
VRPSLHAVTVPVYELFGELASMQHRGTPESSRFSIALLDVDGLSEIDLKHGNDVGDAVLAWVSRTLVSAVTQDEQAAWWAGDQYVVLLPGLERCPALARVRRILRCFSSSLCPDLPTVTVSAGVAAYPVDGVTTRALIDVARAALQKAKRDGRGLVREGPPQLHSVGAEHSSQALDFHRSLSG